MSSDGRAAVSIIRGVLGPIRPPAPLVIISQRWPSWLVVALAHNLPVASAVFPRELHRFFKPKANLSWHTVESLIAQETPAGVDDSLITEETFEASDDESMSTPSLLLPPGAIWLIEGSTVFIKTLLRLIPSVKDCIFCIEPTRDFRHSSRLHRYRSGAEKFLQSLGMSSTYRTHADYGGATSAGHVLGFGSNISIAPPPTPPNVRRGLGHFMSVSLEGKFKSRPPPHPLEASHTHGVIYADSTKTLLRRDGLLPCTKPDASILCPSVFSPTGFVERNLSISEALRVYSIPSSYDAELVSTFSTMTCVLPFESSVSPDILTSFAHHLWGGDIRGGAEGSEVGVCNAVSNVVDDTPKNDEEMQRSEDDVAVEDKVDKSMDVASVAGLRGNNDNTLSEVLLTEPVKEEGYSTEHPEEVKDEVTLTKEQIENISAEAQETLRESVDQTKAAKADDAAVPEYLWNDVIKEGAKPADDRCDACVNYAVSVLRDWGLKMFWKKLRTDCTTRLRKNYGRNWMSLPRKDKKGRLTKLGVEIQALTNIMWHATEANWFEYKSGSALHYFRFPIFYQGIAKEGVRVFFEKDGPKSMRRQPPVADEKARAVLRSKVGKVIKRGYLFGSGIKLRSLIRYFAVPKTDKDFRIVYDATANKLNEAVWAPSFWLPTVETLVRYVDADSWMMDRDIGDMFLNFPLDRRVWPYTGLNLESLFDGTDEEDAAILKMAGSHWVHWGRCLMGFKPSPYNAIKTAMVVEEVARGNRHCDKNPFQWDHIRLNLPGDVDYDPRVSWISKMRKDGLLACDIFTFVDDERVTGATRELTWQAGHRLAYIQAYLGVQDAARKLRELSKRGGAWAGSVVHTISDVGVCVLTTEEKWKRFRDIIQKWLDRVERGDRNLDHKELQKDRGFCVHVCNNYPSMKPFLKGFHLSLEMWRGNRDEEGWKLPTRLHSISEESEEDIDEDEEDVDTDEVMLDQKFEEDYSDDIDTATTATDLTEEDKHEHVDVLRGPPSGETTPAKRFVDDLRALMNLSSSDAPPVRVVRSKTVLAAVYGFGDASGKGFCGTVGYHEDIHYRIGVWRCDEESESSNYKELRNLVETCEEEAAAGRLFNAEFFLFTDNSTAENCYYRGSSKSKLLHELVVRLRKLEMDYNLTIHLIHVSGDRMIDQGTDGGSRGSLLEGVLTGKPMLDFVDLSKTAVERHEPLLDWIRGWTDNQSLSPLTPEQWFVEAHGICGGKVNADGIWMPMHEKKYQTHLWCPPPAVADAALEELLKARHKRTDTFHIIALPRLMTPRWRRLFWKLVDFSCEIPAGSPQWPTNMYEPLWLGIVLPFSHHRPWQLKRAPLLLGLEREMRQVLAAGASDGGGNILRQLWSLNSRLSKVSPSVARQVLRMPREEDRD